MPFIYDKCRICGGEVPDAMRRHAARHITNAICGSAECFRKEYIRDYGCCEKAEPIHCVCAASFRCPDHGERHRGTHD